MERLKKSYLEIFSRIIEISLRVCGLLTLPHGLHTLDIRTSHRRGMVMTRGEFLNLLTKEAKKYRSESLASIERNRHMNDISSKDFRRLKRDRKLTQKMIDALLVDFINTVGVGQCIDYALYTKHLKSVDRT